VRLLRATRSREAFFVSWTTILILIITAMVVLDGGLTSPIAGAYFLPLVFAALSYPVALMVAVSIVDLSAYAGAAIAMGCRGRTWCSSP
jgi:hypothetical protein